jgi:hypothetical protein
VNPDPEGEPVLSPICTNHPESRVFWTYFGDSVTILCKAGAEHVVGTCPLMDFETEKARARSVLDR